MHMHARGLQTSRAWGAVLLALGGVACEDGDGGNGDAGVDGARAEVGAGTDTGPRPLAVDFLAVCPGTTDGGCSGPAPLTVTFVPAVAGNIDVFAWQFGDNTTASEPTPRHTYPLPGSYDVVLTVAGPQGSAARTRASFVTVVPVPVGGRCEVDVQCADGLDCLCGSAGTCAPAFERGICSARCRDQMCAAPAICADLSLAGSASPDEPWRRPTCVSSCAADADCAAGLRCRNLPSRFPAGQWVRGCFVTEPGALGDSCRGPGGSLNNQLCLSALCADWGALGVCSYDCERAQCPQGSACATLSAGGKRCVRSCNAAFACDQDPLLECQLPRAEGPAGFLVTGAAEGARFCAPRRCVRDLECAPAGRCQTEAGSGQCVARVTGPM
jgi:PKD repeat protein